MRERLDQPSVALKLPGFGCPRPDGFSATKDAYAEWVADEIKKIDEPVDLVGHDWGGGFSVRVGMKYPELVRSWVTDVAGVVHPDYVWHDFAQIWQTEGEGEIVLGESARRWSRGGDRDVPTLRTRRKGRGQARRHGRRDDGLVHPAAVPVGDAESPQGLGRLVRQVGEAVPRDQPVRRSVHVGEPRARGRRGVRGASSHRSSRATSGRWRSPTRAPRSSTTSSPPLSSAVMLRVMTLNHLVHRRRLARPPHRDLRVDQAPGARRRVPAGSPRVARRRQHRRSGSPRTPRATGTSPTPAATCSTARPSSATPRCRAGRSTRPTTATSRANPTAAWTRSSAACSTSAPTATTSSTRISCGATTRATSARRKSSNSTTSSRR